MQCEKCGDVWGRELFTAGHPMSLCNPCARAWHLMVLGTDLDLEYQTVLEVLARYRSGGEFRGTVDAGVKVVEKARLMRRVLVMLMDWLGEDSSKATGGSGGVTVRAIDAGDKSDG